MSRYAKHYFNYENALPFFLISFLGLLLVLALILAAARIPPLPRPERPKGSGDSRELL